MSDRPDALQILLEELSTVAPSVPPELVRDVYRIEELVQFDAARPDVEGKIARAIQTHLDMETFPGDSDANAS